MVQAILRKSTRAAGVVISKCFLAKKAQAAIETVKSASIQVVLSIHEKTRYPLLITNSK